MKIDSPVNIASNTFISLCETVGLFIFRNLLLNMTPLAKFAEGVISVNMADIKKDISM